MSLTAFEIIELSEEAAEEYIIQLETATTRFGTTVSHEELEQIGQAMVDAAAGDFDTTDDQHVGQRPTSAEGQ